MKNKEDGRNSVYILGVEAKDLYAAKRLYHPVIENDIVQGYVNQNLKRWKNTLDYSLDLIKLREVAYQHYRNRSSFFYDKDLDKEFTQRVINVDFDLAYKEWNKHGDIYILDGYGMADIKEVGKFGDRTFYKDGICIGVKVGDITESDNEIVWVDVPRYFDYDVENRKIKLAKTIPTLMSRSDIRYDLYEKGFVCNGIKYVRYKRSSGSSRVGKCLFIDEALYPAMHKWELCGLKIKEGDKIDLAAFEAYISLPSSSCIDTLEIRPENILVIDDYESEFEDDVVAVYGEGEDFVAKEERVKIKNSIWDGQSLLDISMYNAHYTDRTMLLLRNRFFKSACFKARIQDWFRDNGITEVSQLKGYTRATCIEDIKLITTPSSIKYVKFGTIDQWLDNLYTTFGIVKYEKPTKYLDGRMVQCHYQLLNTLQLSRDDVQALLQPNFDYLNLIRKDPAVMRYHLKYPYSLADNDDPCLTRDEIVMKVMGMNSKFVETKLYNEFRRKLIESMLKEYRKGHIWINGNYETLIGNGIEMLQAAIGQFNGESVLGVGNVHTKRFEYNMRLLGTRSPHINSGDVLLVNNVDNDLLKKYFVSSKEVVHINSINENILQRLQGADFDSDSILLTDNKILIGAAEKNYRRFKVPTSFIKAKKIQWVYNAESKAKLDINTSVNLIGQIVNLSQYLNSIMWENIYHEIKSGVDIDTAFKNQSELYDNICILSAASGSEIDKAKKMFDVNTSKLLDVLKDKYGVYTEINGKQRFTKPLFFKNITLGNGYSLNPNQHYRQFETSMDYLQKAINKFRADKIEVKNLPFCEIIKPMDIDFNKVSTKKYKMIYRTIDAIKTMREKIQSLYVDYKEKSKEEKAAIANEVNNIRQKQVETINNKSFSDLEIYMLLREIDKDKNAGYARTIFDTLFATGNQTLYEMIKDTSLDIYKITKKTNENSVNLFEYTYFKQKIG
ncbi:MAG: hypothetical protein J6S85_10590 [Methanobrevibacter sp.]|nr:hypothetical protein [Methanobrevibacter sp.]